MLFVWLYLISISTGNAELRWSESRSVTGQAETGHVETEQAESDSDEQDFFEAEVRPLLLRRCVECHGPEQQAGDLRVDSRQRLLQGGQSGPALIPGQPDKSLLFQAVRRSEDLAMPPDEPLSEGEIAVLKRWIEAGAIWPATVASDETLIDRQTQTHWAYQPILRPGIPEVSEPTLHFSPIDAFIQEKLNQVGLKPAAPADRRTLIRRASYVLSGLPPTAEAVDAFVNDSNPQAYEVLIDTLLASPQFGEHWARMWLDVARYSDSKGYVYGREERFWTHAWAYRDWVVQAFNQDLPYDRFVQLQLAADQMAEDPADLAAMGFLTIGRRFLGVKPDILDDRIDVLSRGLLGLTVSCARCHDHKYDAIPTRDYYSLYGVLASCLEVERSVTPESELPSEYLEELKKRQQNYAEHHQKFRAEAAERARDRIADYLNAQLELEKYPGELFGQLLKPTDLVPTMVHRWVDYLRRSERDGNPIFLPWHRLLALSDDEFSTQGGIICEELRQAPATQVHPAIAQALETVPQNRQTVVQMYAGVLSSELERLNAVLNAEPAAESPVSTGEPSEPSEPGDGDSAAKLESDPFWQLLFGETSPCVVPNEPIVEIEYFFDISSCETLWKLQGEIDRWVIQSEVLDRRARILMDRARPVEPQVFRRGSPLRKGEFVPRQFLALLAGPDRVPFSHGSGRLELSQAIIDPDNPLTSRVIVNRLWGAVFGQALVGTPSDFGLRAEPPSHPELLDWLASELQENQWSLKRLIRQMLLSHTFRQSQWLPEDVSLRQAALLQDPDNQLLWRFRPQRLGIEPLRDSLLAVSGGLDLQMGGKSLPLWNAPYSARRSIYGQIDRQYLPGVYRTFDFASPDLHTPTRSATTVAQQALFFMNHPFVLEQASTLGVAAAGQPDVESGVRFLFKQVLQREPTELELLEAIVFLDGTPSETDPTRGAWPQLAQTLFSLNEFMFIE